jgi:hypothetical protein
LARRADIKLSPNNNVIDVLELGTIPIGSASFTFGRIIGTSLALISKLFTPEATPITFIPNLFEYFKRFVNSEVFPE